MLKKFFIFFFFITLSLNNSISEEIKIVYVDIDKIINFSTVGKDIIKKLDIINKKNITKLDGQQKKLIEKEKTIILQKNITSKNDFDKKVSNLKKEIALYKSDTLKSQSDINKKKIEATNKILIVLKEILSEYSSINSITLIMKKNNIVIGKTELDITNEIMDIINKKIKTIKLD